MRLAVSNIAWTQEQDVFMYETLSKLGYEGLEIAPTRLFPEKPYERCEEAANIAQMLKNDFDLTICSMQSIWYGKNQRIFTNDAERYELICYTEMALKFAKAIGCRNIVFGNPKNRNIEGSDELEKGYLFFQRIGDLAQEMGVIIALEPNPVIYGTNFLNSTTQTASFVRESRSAGLRINLDFGTFLFNDEEFAVIEDNLDIINHIHISEPNLTKITRSPKHLTLAAILRDGAYEGYVSLEMRIQDCCDDLIASIAYVKDVFS